MQLDTATRLSSHYRRHEENSKTFATVFREFNGVSVFQDRLWIANEDLQLFTDSAGSPNLGFGAYLCIKAPPPVA